MSNQTGIKVEGGRQIRSQLKAAGEDLSDLKDAHLSAAELVVRAAEPKTPRKTGRLAATGRAAGTATQAIMRWGGGAVKQAGPVHFGWAERNIKPQPWATDTAQETEPQWTEIYFAKVQRVLAKIRGVRR